MATTQWAIDPTHSEIGFKVKHMMFTNVSGNFSEFEASVSTESDDFSSALISFQAKTASISTNNADRDAHLRSDDFFSAEKYPTITFKATSFTKKEDGVFALTGDLTIRDVTKSVTLEAEHGGLMKDPWGNLKSAFAITGKINRKDWGLNWNAALEAGGLLVSEEVKIACEIQLVKVVA